MVKTGIRYDGPVQLTAFTLLVAASLALGPARVDAGTKVVQARPTSFAPEVVFIEPGDTVSWENMMSHNTNSMGDEQGLIPEGAENWVSKLNQDYQREFQTEGVYIYKCDPHYSLGMVGAIVVGEPVNLEQVLNRAEGMAQRAARAAKDAVQERQG